MEIQLTTNACLMTTPTNAPNQQVPSQQIVVNVPQSGITYASLHHIPLGVATPNCQPNGALNVDINKNIPPQKQGVSQIGFTPGTGMPGASHQVQTTFIQMASTIPVQQTGGNMFSQSDVIKMQEPQVEQQAHTQLYQFLQNDATQSINAQISRVTSSNSSAVDEHKQPSNFVKGNGSKFILGSQVEHLPQKESADSTHLKDEVALWNELGKRTMYSMGDFEPLPLAEVKSSEKLASSSRSHISLNNPTPESSSSFSSSQDILDQQKYHQKYSPQQIQSMIHHTQASSLPQLVESTSASGQAKNIFNSKQGLPELMSSIPEQVHSVGPRHPSLPEKETTSFGSKHPKQTDPSTIDAKILPVRASLSKPVGKRKRDDSPYMGTVKLNAAATGTDKTYQKDSPDSPHSIAIRLLEQRGYSTHGAKSLESEYYNVKPTPLQLASFGTELVKAVHKSDIEKLTNLLKCGLSANPCNKFGDSLLDLACKRGNWAIFDCLMKQGCDVKVCDSFGRTPLHHAAWSGNFSPKLIYLILQRDPLQLLLEDKFGKKPLHYVRKEEWSKWASFLMRVNETLWPSGADRPTIASTPRTTLNDPENAVSEDLAKGIAAGTISCQEVAEMDLEQRKNFRGEPINQTSSIFNF